MFLPIKPPDIYDIYEIPPSWHFIEHKLSWNELFDKATALWVIFLSSGGTE